MKLFEPVTIKNMRLKNRIVMPPMQLLLGLQGRRARSFYLERARGGAGAIIMAATSVDLFLNDEAWGRKSGVVKFLERMKYLTEEIRQRGAKIGIQIWHGNTYPAGNGTENFPGSERIAPSAVEGMRALELREIGSIIEKFASAGERARSCGFDFVELHGAHGYLLCQFFSGADNSRKDEYGKDLYARMRFAIETVGSLRRAVGDDFPIFYRLGALEERPHGITLEESSLFAQELEKAGVDVMDVSIGRGANHSASPSKKSEMGTFVNIAASIKERISIPVIAVGRINRPEKAESILKEGKADLIAVGRQLIADPYWPQKAMEGRAQEIVECLSCNHCFRPMYDHTWTKGDQLCRVNESAAREAGDKT